MLSQAWLSAAAQDKPLLRKFLCHVGRATDVRHLFGLFKRFVVAFLYVRPDKFEAAAFESSTSHQDSSVLCSIE